MTEIEKTETNEMSFLEHLEQLRWHIIRGVIAVIVGAIVIFLAKDFVFNTIINGPKSADFLSYRVICSFSDFIGLGDSLCFQAPEFTTIGVGFGELFITHIKVSLVLGIVLAFPYLFYEFWSFVKPGLYDSERKAARGMVLICSLLFISGVLFGYFVIAPFAVSFLAGYTIPDTLNQPTISSYVNYMVMFTVPAGIIFELPVVVYFLSKIGLVTPEFMRKYRKHAFIGILLIAAIITPPDVITQFLIGIPLYVLYEVSIFISKRVKKQQDAELDA